MPDVEHTSGPGADAEAYCSQCGRSYPPGTARCPNDGAPLVQLAADRDQLIGKVLDGRFAIIEAIGHGGMGAVYLGTQLSVDRPVAVKVIHPKLGSDRAVVKRFLREARLASRLSHPAIVNVIEFGQSEGVLYLVTELLRGRTLERELENARLSLHRVLTIALQLCDALEAAHAHDIIHRDLKPGNVMILAEPAGRDLVKVLDFGLAKSLAGDEVGSHVTSNVGVVIGTPAYMAPEQVAGEPTDARTDLYALGCMLYEMVGGAPPFVEPAISAVLARHLADPPAPLADAVPASLRALIDGLLAKPPDGRPQTARAVRGALERILGTPVSGLATVADAAPVTTTVPGLPAAAAVSAVVARPRSRLPIIVAAVCGLAVAAVVAWRLAGGDERAPVADTPAAAADAAVGHADAIVAPPAVAPPDAAPVAAVAPVDAARTPVATPPKRVTPPPTNRPPPRPVTMPARKPAAGSASSTPDLDFYHPH